MDNINELLKTLAVPSNIEVCKADEAGFNHGFPYRVEFEDKTDLLELEIEFAEWLRDRDLIWPDVFDSIDWNSAEEPADIERLLVYLVDARTNGENSLTYLPEDDNTFYFMIGGPDVDNTEGKRRSA